MSRNTSILKSTEITPSATRRFALHNYDRYDLNIFWKTFRLEKFKNVFRRQHLVTTRTKCRATITWGYPLKLNNIVFVYTCSAVDSLGPMANNWKRGPPTASIAQPTGSRTLLKSRWGEKNRYASDACIYARSGRVHNGVVSLPIYHTGEWTESLILLRNIATDRSVTLFGFPTDISENK